MTGNSVETTNAGFILNMNKTVTQFKTKIQRWADRITDTYGNSVQAIVEVGSQLQQAKAECSHGEWGELTGETTGKPLLPFSHQTTRRLKSIAGNPALSNRAHVRDLPASWGTLATLASLDPDDIEAAIADGDIHPAMQRKDAEALKAKIKGTPAPKPQPEPATATSLFTDKMTDEEREYLKSEMADLEETLRQHLENQKERRKNAIENRRLANTPEARAATLGLDVLARTRQLAQILEQSDVQPVLTKPHHETVCNYIIQIDKIIRGH